MSNSEVTVEQIIDSLPMFDSVIQEIIMLISDERTTAMKLERVIKKDAVLSLKILKLANSSYFSPLKPITSIAHSVRYIGLSTLKSLVYSIALQSVGKKGSFIPKEIKTLQKKCLVNAIISMMLGKHYCKNNRCIFSPDDFYVFGLFHDIGLLAVAGYDLKNLYIPVYEEVKAGSDLLTAEKNVQDILHTDVGDKLLNKWEIPEIYRIFASKHHIEKLLESEDIYLPRRIVNLSEAISLKLGYDDFAELGLDIETELQELNIPTNHFINEEGDLTPVQEIVDDMLAGMSL